MKQIEVTIMGHSYLLGCPEGGERNLQEAVSRVDREMCNIRDAGKIKARERIAVLAALNLAYSIVQRPAAPASAAAEPKSQDAAELSDDQLPDISALLRKLDQVLGQDGHLL